jgi:uncharacterized protein
MQMPMTIQKPSAEDLIAHFKLEPLPVEGVLFTQVYRSAELIDAAARPARYRGEKPFGTVALALFIAGGKSISALHRLQTDEVWHFYLGDPLELLLLHPDGASEHVLLGNDVLAGQHIVHVVPRGTWMGAHVHRDGAYALVGNTMAPGFTSSDFEGGLRDALIAQYPAERDGIIALTHDGAHEREMPEGY